MTDQCFWIEKDNFLRLKTNSLNFDFVSPHLNLSTTGSVNIHLQAVTTRFWHTMHGFPRGTLPNSNHGASMKLTLHSTLNHLITKSNSFDSFWTHCFLKFIFIKENVKEFLKVHGKSCIDLKILLHKDKLILQLNCQNIFEICSCMA